jgi:hypothetical protein
VIPEDVLKEIVNKGAALRVYEKRCVSDTYCELVIHNEEVSAWEKILTDCLGPAVKPVRARPSREDAHLTKAFGGIRADQTLFKKVLSDATAIAMFWPWQDDDHTTIKIALLKALS